VPLERLHCARAAGVRVRPPLGAGILPSLMFVADEPESSTTTCVCARMCVCAVVCWCVVVVVCVGA
jgi:hypothetical protein